LGARVSMENGAAVSGGRARRCSDGDACMRGRSRGHLRCGSDTEDRRDPAVLRGRICELPGDGEVAHELGAGTAAAQRNDDFQRRVVCRGRGEGAHRGWLGAAAGRMRRGSGCPGRAGAHARLPTSARTSTWTATRLTAPRAEELDDAGVSRCSWRFPSKETRDM
jgi:hypothetical protein